MSLLWVFLFVSLVSWVLTGLLRRYAIAKSLVDVPNDRSSHSVLTPRGGGVSIVIAFFLGLSLLWLESLIETKVFIGLSVSGALIAVIGIVDDHGHVAARWRLIGHFIASGWLVFWLGGLPVLQIFGVSVESGAVGVLLLIISLVWLLNLYNFMDGIDGLAGIEALSSTFVVALLLLFVFSDLELALLNLLMFASVGGFLLWNFPTARIFMGDAGSCFLGLMLGALALLSAHIDQQMLWVWLILLGCFIVDATVTLVRRLLHGDKIFEAHRSHAYQYASRKYSSHKVVTLAVLFINLFWLTPWAVLVLLEVIEGVLGVIIAYSPLLWLSWYFHAGLPEEGR